MKKIFISVLLLSALTFNATAEDFSQKNDTTKVVKQLASIKKVGMNDNAIDATTGEEVKSAVVPKKKEEPKINSKPTFPGGEKAIRDFVRTTMKYPKECEAERLVGRVTITMTINIDGTPENIKILRSSGNKFMDAEALRVAKLMPKWTPAADKKNAESIQYMLPIQFRPVK